jgi:hypothetical protein
MPGKSTDTQFSDVLRKSNQIDVTVTGRVSGRRISNPVWFVEDHGNVYLLPVRGSDTDWFKNVVASPSLRITADGASVTASATPITDPARVRDVIGRFQEKYGEDQIRAYYHLLDVAVETRIPA